MKYNDNGEWKDVQIKVANAIQNEYGESNNDGYSQNYLNDKVVNVGTEVDSRNRVNVLKSNNLCNGVNMGDWLNTAANTAGATAEGNTGLHIKVDGGNYTISTDITQARYRVACFDTLPLTSTGQTAYNGVNKDGTSDTITINTTGHNYLIVNATDLSKIYIAKGNTPTTEPYITPSINVDGEEIYSKDNLGLIKTKQLGITFSSSGTNIILTISVNLLDIGTILISGKLIGIDDVILNFIISYASRYSYELISKRGTNIGNNNITASYSNNAIVMTIPFVATNMPTGIGTVKASMIYLG